VHGPGPFEVMDRTSIGFYQILKSRPGKPVMGYGIFGLIAMREKDNPLLVMCFGILSSQKENPGNNSF
jgi:hypothetical protein